MSDTYYTEDHEYVTVVDGVGTIGISDYAQNQLGDVVYVELPEVGATFEQKEEAGVVESVKVASEIYSPVSGEVVEVNEALESEPGLVNSDPLGDGWFFKIRLSDEKELDELKDEHDYDEYLAELE